MRKIALSLLLASSLFANVGKIVTLRGDVIISNNNHERTAKTNDILEENDTIITKNNAKLQIKFIDNTIVTLGKNTTLNINDYVIDGKNSKVNLKVNNGHFKVMSGNISKIARENFAFQAKTATIGIRGTVFVGSLGKIDKVGCLEGAIDVKVGNKSQLINAGKQLRFDNDKIVKIEKIVPKDYETINTGKITDTNKKSSYKGDDNFNDFLNKKEEMIRQKKSMHKNYHNENYKGEYKGNYKGGNKYGLDRINGLDSNAISKDIQDVCHNNSACIQNKINSQKNWQNRGNKGNKHKGDFQK